MKSLRITETNPVTLKTEEDMQDKMKMRISTGMACRIIKKGGGLAGIMIRISTGMASRIIKKGGGLAGIMNKCRGRIIKWVFTGLMVRIFRLRCSRFTNVSTIMVLQTIITDICSPRIIWKVKL
jgi:hypothetical protein